MHESPTSQHPATRALHTHLRKSVALQFFLGVVRNFTHDSKPWRRRRGYRGSRIGRKEVSRESGRATTVGLRPTLEQQNLIAAP